MRLLFMQKIKPPLVKGKNPIVLIKQVCFEISLKAFKINYSRNLGVKKGENQSRKIKDKEDESCNILVKHTN